MRKEDKGLFIAVVILNAITLLMIAFELGTIAGNQESHKNLMHEATIEEDGSAEMPAGYFTLREWQVSK